eukprot:m.151916 g.151916  ORF g.151916 m.151916 type:complete len:581 (+) comp15100_c2_seq1:987-2729(+)
MEEFVVIDEEAAQHLVSAPPSAAPLAKPNASAAILSPKINEHYQQALDKRLFWALAQTGEEKGVGRESKQQTRARRTEHLPSSRCSGDAAPFLIFARSLQAKAELLDTAIASGDGSAIIQVCLHLQSSLSPQHVTELLATRPAAVQALCSYYRRRCQWSALAVLQSQLQMTADLLVTQYCSNTLAPNATFQPAPARPTPSHTPHTLAAPQRREARLLMADLAEEQRLGAWLLSPCTCGSECGATAAVSLQLRDAAHPDSWHGAHGHVVLDELKSALLTKSCLADSLRTRLRLSSREVFWVTLTTLGPATPAMVPDLLAGLPDPPPASRVALALWAEWLRSLTEHTPPPPSSHISPQTLSSLPLSLEQQKNIGIRAESVIENSGVAVLDETIVLQRDGIAAHVVAKPLNARPPPAPFHELIRACRQLVLLETDAPAQIAAAITLGMTDLVHQAAEGLVQRGDIATAEWLAARIALHVVDESTHRYLGRDIERCHNIVEELPDRIAAQSAARIAGGLAIAGSQEAATRGAAVLTAVADAAGAVTAGVQAIVGLSAPAVSATTSALRVGVARQLLRFNSSRGR